MKPISDAPRFPIGASYTPSGKAKRQYVVTDILRTYNAAGELVRLRYVGKSEIMGQPLFDHDVCDTTIARGGGVAFIASQ